jgi:hypothetical protein
VGLAEDLLGRHFLGQLHAAMRPGARLALGLASAWGFGPDEHQLEGPDATPFSCPYGLREAIRFLAEGYAQHPVEQVAGPAGLLPAESRWIEVPSWHS